MACQRLASVLNRWALLALLTGAMLGLAYLVPVLVERRLSKPLGNLAGWLLNQRLGARQPAEASSQGYEKPEPGNPQPQQARNETLAW